MAIGGIVDVQWTVHGFLQNLSQNGQSIDIGTRFHYSGELFEFTLGYLAMLLLAVVVGLATLVKAAVAERPQSPSLSRVFLAMTLFQTSVVGGMILNRYRTEELFSETGLAHTVSSTEMLKPWKNAAHLYPDLILMVGVGAVAIWTVWFGARWLSQRFTTL